LFSKIFLNTQFFVSTNKTKAVSSEVQGRKIYPVAATAANTSTTTTTKETKEVPGNSTEVLQHKETYTVPCISQRPDLPLFRNSE